MSDPRFLQTGFDKQLATVVEECGEVLAAAGKTQRWGRESVNPLIPAEEQETNEAWLRRELNDLKDAISRLETTMDRDTPSVVLPQSHGVCHDCGGPADHSICASCLMQRGA